jgi:SAM-dependent methyltransferase
MLVKAREYAVGVNNPPAFDFGDAIAPPLEPASVDVVAHRNVMWTLLDPARAFRNWFTVLRPGGRLIALHGVHTVSLGREPEGAHSDTYTDEIRGRLLGIHRQATVEPALPIAREAGFIDVKVTRLLSIEAYERELEKVTHQPAEKTWLALTATRPASPR